MIFADATPDANTTWLVLVALSGIAGNLAQILIARMMARRQVNEIYPQPLQVEMAKKFADKHEFDREVKKNNEQHDEFLARFRDLESEALRSMQKLSNEWRNWADGKFAALLDSNDKGRNELHVKINGAREEVSALEATAAIQNQQLAAMEHKIDGLASKIIADLRNAKGLL